MKNDVLRIDVQARVACPKIHIISPIEEIIAKYYKKRIPCIKYTELFESYFAMIPLDCMGKKKVNALFKELCNFASTNEEDLLSYSITFRKR